MACWDVFTYDLLYFCFLYCAMGSKGGVTGDGQTTAPSCGTTLEGQGLGWAGTALSPGLGVLCFSPRTK